MTMAMIMTNSRRRRRCRTDTNSNNNNNSNRRSSTILLPTTTIGILSFLIAASSAIVVVEGYCPVVICPGFCNDSHDYETDQNQNYNQHQPLSLSDGGLSLSDDSSSLKSVLAKRGFSKSHIYTIPVQRHDWLRSIAGGLFFDYRNFQQCTTTPYSVAYGWYIKRLKQMVDIAYEESGGQKVLLIGHSAGGWLARAAMGDGIWSEESSDDNGKVTIRTSDRIRCLATIGSIHKAPEQDQTCVTRGALKYTNDNYPGAFLKNDGIGYVSIGGTTASSIESIKDEEELSKSRSKSIKNNKSKSNMDEAEKIHQRVAYTSYKAVSGNEKYIIGDGVVPIEWTQLMGSKQIQLNNVLHSKHNYRATSTGGISATSATSTTQQQQQQQHWYGSENVIDSWLSFVLEESNLLQRVVKITKTRTKRVDATTTARTAGTFFDNLLVKTRVAVAVLGEKQVVQEQEQVLVTITTSTTRTFDNKSLIVDNRGSSLSSSLLSQQQRRRRQRTTKYHVRSFNILLRRTMLQVFLLFLKIMNMKQQQQQRSSSSPTTSSPSSSLFNFNFKSNNNNEK